jgi:hypothetical protein
MENCSGVGDLINGISANCFVGVISTVLVWGLVIGGLVGLLILIINSKK